MSKMKDEKNEKKKQEEAKGKKEKRNETLFALQR